MYLNGKVTSVHSVLANTRLAPVLSDEGALINYQQWIQAAPRRLERLQNAAMSVAAQAAR
jgi:predicted trehalose synthase